MGWFLFLKLLEGTRPYSTQQVQYFFFPHLFFALGIQGGLPSHTLRITSQGTIFLPRQKKSTRNSLFFTPLQFHLPFCLFFFFFSFRDCCTRFYRSSERQKRFSWFFSLFWERELPKFYSTFAYSSIDSCFCPLAHFSPGHALRIRSVRHHFWTGLARVVFAWQLVLFSKRYLLASF